MLTALKLGLFPMSSLDKEYSSFSAAAVSAGDLNVDMKTNKYHVLLAKGDGPVSYHGQVNLMPILLFFLYVLFKFSKILSYVKKKSERFLYTLTTRMPRRSTMIYLIIVNAND